MMMFRGTIMCFLCFIITLVVPNNYFCGSEVIQEGAFVRSCDPKYMINCTAITKRAKRGDPYKTTAGGTILDNWNNNVTFKITYGTKSMPEMVHLKMKVCDTLKIGWARDYLKTYSNVSLTCPLPKGKYLFRDMEMPPKNFPLPIPKGETIHVRLGAEVTETGKDMGEFAFVARCV